METLPLVAMFAGRAALLFGTSTRLIEWPNRQNIEGIDVF